MTVFEFESMAELASFFENKAKEIRGRITTANTATAKHTMRAEAHAYEQAAWVISAAKIKETA